MDRRNWSPPALESGQRKARDSPDATGSSPPPGARWAAKFILSLVFFGVIGALFSSWFPISLGAVLFFTDEDFVEWALQTIGIRLVPDTLGSIFIKMFVFLIGWLTLLAYWRDSAPEWLASDIPPGAPPWSLIAGAALLIAVLSTASAALVSFVAPEIARSSRAWRITRALIALVMFGMVALFVYAFRPLQTRYEFPQAASTFSRIANICAAPSTNRPRFS